MSSIAVSISIILSFFCVKKIFNREKGILFLIIAVFTTPLYLYCAEYYTDVFSMPISVLLFYIWICMDVNNRRKKTILSIIYAVILFIGIKLKLTSAFVFIAIIMYELGNRNYKELLKRVLPIGAIVIILTVMFDQIIVNKLAPKENRWINEVPKEHWIMMGMNGVGKFSYEEYKYTNSNETYDQKKKADIRKIKERIVNRSTDEHIKNITLKLGFAWHDRNILGT